MKCFFCKSDTFDSKSVEHIIPESLGNKQYILGKGIVCDNCNNYFSREIEGPVQSYEDIRRLMALEDIRSKKGKRRSTTVLFGGEECQLDVTNINGEETILLGISPEMVQKLYEGKLPEIALLKGVNFYKFKDDYLFSRFLCKIAIECLVYNFILYDKYDEIEALVTNEIYKEIINFVRIGNRLKKPWNITAKVLHDYMPFEKNEYYVCKCYFDDHVDDDSIVFNIEFFGTKFSIDILNE